MASSILKSAQRIARRVLSAPFQNLPPEYGNTVPPELQAFEAEAEAYRKDTVDKVQVSEVHHAHSQPARRDESLERE